MGEDWDRRIIDTCKDAKSIIMSQSGNYVQITGSVNYNIAIPISHWERLVSEGRLSADMLQQRKQIKQR